MTKDFYTINQSIKNLIHKGIVNPHIGEAKLSVPVKIEGVNTHARMHGITLEQAQSFVDTSVVMFEQGNRTMYLSRDGSATVIIENKRLISAYGREYFDDAIKTILEVIDSV